MDIGRHADATMPAGERGVGPCDPVGGAVGSTMQLQRAPLETADMISFFTVPKPFVGHIGTIQRNAIVNWLQSAPGAEVLIFGDEPGAEAAAAETGARHIRRVHRSPYGAPLLDDVFREAARLAAHDTLCFANADIVFRGDVAGAVATAAPAAPFLMIGESTDMAVREPLRFDQAEWRHSLPLEHRPRGPLALDYFFYRRGLFDEVPPFSMGRARFDNWLVAEALARRATVIDATRLLDAIHQRHDYAHLTGGRQEAYRGPDALRNQRLAGLWCYLHLYSIIDAPFVLTSEGLCRRSRRFAFLQQLWHRSLGLMAAR